MSELVEGAKAALEGITQGPWRHEIGEEHGETVHYVQWGIESSVGIFTGNYGAAGNDAEFIAASRQLVPELIAEIERLYDVIGQELDWFPPGEAPLVPRPTIGPQADVIRP